MRIKRSGFAGGPIAECGFGLVPTLETAVQASINANICIKAADGLADRSQDLLKYLTDIYFDFRQEIGLNFED
jgi:hypothetical protein